MAGGSAGAASIAFFFVDLNNFSYHFFPPEIYSGIFHAFDLNPMSYPADGLSCSHKISFLTLQMEFSIINEKMMLKFQQMEI